MVTTEYTGICVFKAGLEDLSDITRGQGAPTATSSWERQRVDCSQSSGRGSDPSTFSPSCPSDFCLLACKPVREGVRVALSHEAQSGHLSQQPQGTTQEGSFVRHLAWGPGEPDPREA